VVAVGKKGVGYSLLPYVYDPHLLVSDRESTYRSMAQMKKKKKGDQAGDARHLAAMESNVFTQCTGIVAHCAVTRYDDGDPRKTGWLTIKTQGSAWVVEAKDPDTCGRLQVVQASLDDALALMSVMLESEEAPWEHDVWLAQQKAKESKPKK